MKTIKRSIFSLLIVGLAGCSPKVGFPTLSSHIYNKTRGNSEKSIFNLSVYKNEARMQAYIADTTDLLKATIDTLYLLEGYNIETATFYGTIWNRKKTINYSYRRGNLTWLKQSIFSDYQIKLVTQWDTTTIRREEKANGNWFDDNLQINAIRAVQKERGWQIDEINFKNFFDPKRDNK